MRKEQNQYIANNIYTCICISIYNPLYNVYFIYFYIQSIYGMYLDEYSISIKACKSRHDAPGIMIGLRYACEW